MTCTARPTRGCTASAASSSIPTAELDDGNCPDHGTPPQLVAEENWFFRLSRYADRLHAEISSGTAADRARRAAATRCSASSPAAWPTSACPGRSARARGWGIGVPGDPSQVIYVWWDALGNYITSLSYGTGGAGLPALVGRRGPAHAPGRQGRAPLPRGLLAGDPALGRASRCRPRSSSTTTSPSTAARSASRRGTAARQRPGRAGRAPTAPTRCAGGCCARCRGSATPTSPSTGWSARANEDLANGLGNLVSRVVSLVHSCRNGVVRPCARPAGTSRWLAAGGGCGAADAPDWPADAADLLAAIERTPGAVRAALARFDFRAATAAVWAIVEQANRYVDATEPWHLARAERAGDAAAGARLDPVLGALIAACQILAAEIWPFLPDLAARVAAACNDSGGVLPCPRRLPADRGAAVSCDGPTAKRGRRMLIWVPNEPVADGLADLDGVDRGGGRTRRRAALPASRRGRGVLRAAVLPGPDAVLAMSADAAAARSCRR